jgi:endonuclease/exonuclease/phosphatase family metal-dependent hydrolase
VAGEVQITAFSWNLFHGRDAPPEPDLFTLRSRLFRRTERGDTHIQINRDLYSEFASVIAGASWDVAMLQECPPHWSEDLAAKCEAELHRVLTSRNWLPRLSAVIHRYNPDLVASSEGGSNTTLVRPALGTIVERRELELTRQPERRMMAFCRVSAGICIANLHTTNDRPTLAAEELRTAAEAAVDWSGDLPLILGGDLNLRPRHSPVFGEIAKRYGFSEPVAPLSIDHLLVRGLRVVEPQHAWPVEARETQEEGLSVRLSDHAPIEARFAKD